MLLPLFGARARSGSFAPDGACGEAALASTSGAATRLQPTESTSTSSPVAPSPGAPSATKNRSGLRCRQVAFAPCPRCLSSPAARWSRAAFRSLGARLVTAPQPPSMSGVSSPKAARDVGGATNWTGVAASYCPPPASDGPRWHRPLPKPGPGRFEQGLSGCASAISPGAAWLVPDPVWLAADDRKWPANIPWSGHDPNETNLEYSGSQAPCRPV